MKRDLETLSNTLWEHFEKATLRQPNYKDYDCATSGYPSNNAIEGRKSLAQLAQAIVVVEREMRARDESKNGMTLPGKR